MKNILIDGGDFQFRSLMACKAQGNLPMVSYQYCNMLISTLKRVGADPEDRIIIAVDSSSWRKNFLGEYKANRKVARDKQADEIPWEKIFKDFDKLYLQLEESTCFNVLREWSLEADDFIAHATKFYYPEECIIVSRDADMKQLCARDNVKFFSTAIKCKNGNGAYCLVKNPYQIISHKVAKGDVADNIIVRDTDTEEDVKLRELVINLLELPKDIEQKIEARLKKLEPKINNMEKFPFKSLAKRFYDIYKKDKVVTWEDSMKAIEKKKKKQALKAKQRREAKKLEKNNG